MSITLKTPAIRAEHPLYEGADWEFGTIQRVHDAVAEIAHGELGLDTYPNQIEVINSEQKNGKREE